MTNKIDIPADLSEKLFDNQAIVVVQPISDYRHCLYQSELALVNNVSEKRLLEFSTGRDCAHQALHKIGYETCPILKGEQREPLWPEGVVGSISHCKDLAGAVVANNQVMRSIGFDIENRKELNPAISRNICAPNEKRWIEKLPVEQQNLGLLLIFSLKEAVFKCVYHAIRYRMSFKECRLAPSFHESEIEACFNAEHSALDCDKIRLHNIITDTHIYTSAFYYGKYSNSEAN